MQRWKGCGIARAVDEQKAANTWEATGQDLLTQGSLFKEGEKE